MQFFAIIIWTVCMLVFLVWVHHLLALPWVICSWLKQQLSNDLACKYDCFHSQCNPHNEKLCAANWKQRRTLEAFHYNWRALKMSFREIRGRFDHGDRSAIKVILDGVSALLMWSRHLTSNINYITRWWMKFPFANRRHQETSLREHVKCCETPVNVKV